MGVELPELADLVAERDERRECGNRHLAERGEPDREA
jgi:hypothetical protein